MDEGFSFLSVAYSTDDEVKENNKLVFLFPSHLLEGTFSVSGGLDIPDNFLRNEIMFEKMFFVFRYRLCSVSQLMTIKC